MDYINQILDCHKYFKQSVEFNTMQEAEYSELIREWRGVYKSELRDRKQLRKKVCNTEWDPESYFNVRRPSFVKISPDDHKYVRTFRMVSYGMLHYSPSLRTLILRNAGYDLAHRLVEKKEIKDVDDLPVVFLNQKIGLLDIVNESFNKMEINLYECISCYNAPPIGRTLCDFEAGIIQGALETLIGANVTKEIYCFGLGNSFCGFEVAFE